MDKTSLHEEEASEDTGTAKTADPGVTEMASPGKGRGAGTIILATVINIVVTISLIALYDFFLAPKIISYDLTGFISTQRDLYLGGKLTSEQLRGNFDVLEKNFVKLRSNEVVLNAESVLRNGKPLVVDTAQNGR